MNQVKRKKPNFATLSSHKDRSVYKTFRFFLVLIVLTLFYGFTCYGQIVPQRYANNPASVQWLNVQTAHFKIVFPTGDAAVAQTLAPEAEQVYGEYKSRLGTAPSRKITIYYNGTDGLVSDIHAQNIDDDYSIWIGSPTALHIGEQAQQLEMKLRKEIAYAFQENIKYFPIDYWFYLFSRPSKSPWSDGFVTYLAAPDKTPYDVSAMRNYWHGQQENEKSAPPLDDFISTTLGRSQWQYFTNVLKDHSLEKIYADRQYLFGIIPYFDFSPAFKNGSDTSYEAFQKQWQKDLSHRFDEENASYSLNGDSLVSRILDQKGVSAYRGGAINKNGHLIAAIAVPNSGRFFEQLRIIPLDKNKRINEKKMITEGFFQPEMDWSPAQDKLAFAKRRYDQRPGNYYYQLEIWNAETGITQKIGRHQNARFPAFSADGTQLAYVEKTPVQNVIWIKNLKGGSPKMIYTFASSVSVTGIDYNPYGNQLLISYQQDEDHKAGILTINTKQFARLNLQANVSLHARWSPDGNAVYFNKEAQKVPAIFKMKMTGTTLSDSIPFIEKFYGTELWDTAQDSTGKIMMLTHIMGPDWGGKMNVYSQKKTEKSSSPAFRVTNSRYRLTSQPESTDTVKNQGSSDSSIKPYNALRNTRWEMPFAVPYYTNPGDFGLAGYVKLLEPMRTHEFNYYGSLSFADPLNKSFFYSEYINNMFRPRLKIAFNHFPAASGFFGPKRRQLKTVNVIALTSLWKLTGLSHDYSNWYAGLTLRYLALDYFSEATLHSNHPHIFLNNTKTRQTDLKATLAWRSLNPSRHTLIHPLDGEGVRFLVTASDKSLGSESRYARFNLDGYTVLPAIANDRIFLYANGVIDAGEPVGRDYLNFSNSGDYQLPGPDFTGKVDPGIDRFIRGYTKPLLGDRFVFGKVEYRIPFEFDTKKKLLGLIPPARTSFTFFADGGVMGNARTSADEQSTQYRYSIGAEVKRVFSFGGDFRFTYEFGLAQPLTQSFGPTPYINLKSALPF